MSAAAVAIPAAELYGRGLEGRERLIARAEGGRARTLPIACWLGAPTMADESCCGMRSGRSSMLAAGPAVTCSRLRDAACPPSASTSRRRRCESRRARGAAAIEGSIFERVRGAGTWGSALLLDGNVGIGGDPVALLRRIGALLAPGGRILVELARPGAASGRRRMRLELAAAASPWFDWATVSAADVAVLAGASGLDVRERWSVRGRWFAVLELSSAAC